MIQFYLVLRQPTPVLLPGKSHDRRARWAAVHGVAKSRARLKWLHFRFSLSCIGKGNGTPLQYPCLENPRDGGAWWAAVYGVAQSRARLKRLSSSSIRVFSNESVLHIRWPKYWSFSISLSSKYSGLISFRIGWFDLLSVQRSLKSLLKHHSSKASFLWYSAFFMVQVSHPYMTTRKTFDYNFEFLEFYSGV